MLLLFVDNSLFWTSWRHWSVSLICVWQWHHWNMITNVMPTQHFHYAKWDIGLQYSETRLAIKKYFKIMWHCPLKKAILSLAFLHAQTHTLMSLPPSPLSILSPAGRVLFHLFINNHNLRTMHVGESLHAAILFSKKWVTYVRPFIRQKILKVCI